MKESNAVHRANRRRCTKEACCRPRRGDTGRQGGHTARESKEMAEPTWEGSSSSCFLGEEFIGRAIFVARLHKLHCQRATQNTFYFPLGLLKGLTCFSPPPIHGSHLPPAAVGPGTAVGFLPGVPADVGLQVGAFGVHLAAAQLWALVDTCGGFWTRRGCFLILHTPQHPRSHWVGQRGDPDVLLVHEGHGGLELRKEGQVLSL